MKKSFEQIPFDPAKWPFFYGWMVLVWGVVGIILSVPGQTTGVSAFIEPLLEALHVDRVDLADAYMYGTISSSLLLTPAGKLFDRIGARWIGFGACFMLGLVLVLLSQSDRAFEPLRQMLSKRYAVLGLFGIMFFMLRLSGQGILTMASRNMIMKWFDRHRGLASGLSGAAVSFGFSYAPTFFNKLISVHGWSGTWLLIGIVHVVVFAPLLLVFFRDHPEASGLIPDGKELPPIERKKPEINHPFTLPEARKTFAFWAFALTLSLHALAVTAITFNIESIFERAGMEGSQGFALFPPSALISVVINIGGGWLIDRTQLRWYLSLMLFAMFGYLASLIFLKPGWPVVGIILSYGIATGLFGLLMSITWPRYFGREHLGAISGLCMALVVVASAVGPTFFSRSLQATGSYAVSLLVCLSASILLFAFSFFACNPQRNAVQHP